MIAFARESVLITLRLDGHCDLRGDEFDEFDVELIVSAGLVGPEIDHAETLMRSCHRHTANRFYWAVAQRLRIRESIVLFEIVNDDGFLMLPDPARDRAFYRYFRRFLLLSRFARFEQMQAHDVVLLVVQAMHRLHRFSKTSAYLWMACINAFGSDDIRPFGGTLSHSCSKQAAFAVVSSKETWQAACSWGVREFICVTHHHSSHCRK